MKIADFFWRKRGFITRQCIAVGVCSTLILAGISLVVLWYTYWRVTDNLRRLVMGSVRSDADKLEATLRTARHFAEGFAVTLEYTRFPEDELLMVLELQLKMFQDHDPSVAGCSVAYLPEGTTPEAMRQWFRFRFLDGRTTIRICGGRDERYWETPWFIRAREEKRVVWREPYFDSILPDVLLTSCSVPFFRKSADGVRRFAGVVTIDLELRKFRELLSPDVVPGGYSALISRDGLFLAHPDPMLDGRGSLFKLVQNPRYRELAKATTYMANGGEGILHVNRTTIIDEPVLFFFTPVRSCGWTLVSVFPTRVIYERINSLLWLLLGCSIGGAVLLVLLVSAVLRKTGQPLAELASAALHIGKGNFRAPLPQYAADDEIGRLTASIRSMQVELQNRIRQLAHNIATREKIESELKVAQNIQQHILPVFQPPLPECEEFVLAAQLTSARIVSGDLYDAFMIDEHRIALMIGDVSGKGVPAALVMAVTQTFQRCVIFRCAHTGMLATQLNRMLSQNNPDVMYVTYFVGIVDLRTGVLEYTNAGHHAPVLLRTNGTLDELPVTHGLPMGMMADGEYGFDTVPLLPGDALFAWTDGIIEAENRKQEQYGKERLFTELSRKRGAESPRLLLTRVTGSVNRFTDGWEVFDDMTLLCFKLKKLQDT